MPKKSSLLLLVLTSLTAVLCVGPLRAQDDGVRVIGIDDETLDTPIRSDKPVPVNRVIAVVDDRVLTMADYRAEHGDTVLTHGRIDPMIDRLLLLEAAEQAEVQAPEERIDQMVDRQLDRMGQQPGGLERMLRQRQLTEQQFRNQLRRRIKKQALESRVLVEYYPEVRDQDTRPAYVSVRARLLYVDSAERAWRIYGWLQDQPTEATWNRLYEDHSRKLSLMATHGDLGWFNWGQYSRSIEYPIYKIPLYTVSRPFPLRDGYALVYPTGYRLDPTNPEASRSLKVYRQYQRRYLLEQLYERLRDEMNVIVPTSVERRMTS